MRVVLSSTGSGNTSIGGSWYLFDPNHASDLSEIGGEELGNHVGDNFERFFQNGGAASSATISYLATPGTIADAVWQESFLDHYEVANSFAELLIIIGTYAGDASSYAADILDDTGTTGVKVASNGMAGVSMPAVTLANGPHGGAAATLTAERIVVISTTSNEPAVKLTGNGTGAGLLANGGATGDGATLQGGASGGAGLRAIGQAGTGISASGGGSANPGISASGGANAAGIAALGGSGTGHGIAAATIGSGHGIYAVGGSTGNGATFQGSTTGAGMALVGGATGEGLAIAGGSTSGDGISVDVTDGDALSANVVEQIWTGAALTEAYAADGATATPAQLLYMIYSVMSQFEIVEDEIICKRLDGSTDSMKFLMNSETNPTLRTRNL